MATMQELRQEAKAVGVPVSEIRSAESAEELQGMIAGATTRPKKKKGSVMVRKTVKKSATKKSPATAVKRGRGRPPGSKNKPKVTTEIKRRGRPPGSKNKATVSAPKKRGRPPGVKNKTTVTKNTVRKAATKKTASNGRYLRNVQSTEGRNILDAIDYSDTEGWNPRQDSVPDVILNSLRRYRGNREKVFEALKGRIWEFVGKKLRNGSKRSLSDAHAMLKYRIARTDWDFALKTGQHEVSTNRAEYGTAGTGTGAWKPAKKRAATAPKRRGRPPGSKSVRTTVRKTTPAKRRGRPPGSKNKATATKAIAKRGPGRPKGSKNKR